MSRNLLHRSKLGAFKAWLAEQGIEHRPGRGDYQVLQVMTERSSWQVVYDRGDDREHFTVTGPLEHTVRKFINAAAKRPQSGSDTPPLATEWTEPSTNESSAHPAAGEATERADAEELRFYRTHGFPYVDHSAMFGDESLHLYAIKLPLSWPHPEGEGTCAATIVRAFTVEHLYARAREHIESLGPVPATERGAS